MPPLMPQKAEWRELVMGTDEVVLAEAAAE
jgi:hypothetical protein